MKTEQAALYMNTGGWSFRCESCEQVHLEFGNLAFQLREAEVDKLCDYIRMVDLERHRECVGQSPYKRKYQIELKNTGVYMAFSEAEFRLFRDLLLGTQSRLLLQKLGTRAGLSLN